MSDFTPDNPLEEVLFAASTGSADPAAFLDALRDSAVIVPAEAGETDEEVSFPVIRHEEQQFVPVFTSEAQAQKAAPGQSGWVKGTGAEIAAMLPERTGIAINPGGDMGVALPEEAVGALKGPSPLRFPAGSNIRVGLPIEEPPELREAIAAWGASQPDVVAVHRALIQAEGQPEATLVLGLEVVPGADEEAVIDAAVRNLRGVGAVVLHEGATDPLSRFMWEQNKPLYRAT
jgi:hypothetical protein